MVFSVMLWPKKQPGNPRRALYAFNLDEHALRSWFVDPWDRGQAITWQGRTVRVEDIDYIKIAEANQVWDEDELRRMQHEFQAFDQGRDVTNAWIAGPPGRATGHEKPTYSALDVVVRICRRFDAVARQLRWRHDSRDTLRIADEYDVQDLMHALLLLEFEDVRAESWNPDYLGGASRVDFLLRDAGIVVEVKKTRAGLTDREIGKQLAEDVTRYSDPGANRGANILVCFIYDPDRLLRNANGLERDLTDASHERLAVVGVVSPS